VIGMLFKLIACQPHLMLGLAQSFTNWWSAELRRFGRSWKRRISLYVVGGCSFMLGSMYTGVSVLLWGALPVIGVRAEPAVDEKAGAVQALTGV
jgi:hypothetical protein